MFYILTMVEEFVKIRDIVGLGSYILAIYLWVNVVIGFI